MNESENVYCNKKSLASRDIRRLIEDTFQSVPFTGAVTVAGGHPCELLSEDEEWGQIQRTLGGRGWADIPAEFVRSYPDALALLTEDAFVAFVPCWLLLSLEAADGSVRENLIYMLSPKHDMVPDTTDFIVHRLQKFTQAQRGVVAVVLRNLAKVETSSFLRELIKHALILVERPGGVSNDTIIGSA